MTVVAGELGVVWGRITCSGPAGESVLSRMATKDGDCRDGSSASSGISAWARDSWGSADWAVATASIWAGTAATSLGVLGSSPVGSFSAWVAWSRP